VVLCTYNGERYLAEQLASLAAQTRLPDALFVRDDCSTDETPGILRDFSASAPFPVDVRHNPERLGYNRNYSEALCEPVTDLVALCDQDDVWHPGKLSVLCRLLDEDPEAAGACGDAVCVAGDGTELGTTIWQMMEFSPELRRTMSGTGELGQLLRHNVIQGSSVVLRGSFKNLVVPFSEYGVYDYWIATLVQAVSHLAFAPEPLQQYRMHEENAVGLVRPGHSLKRVLRTSWKERTGYTSLRSRRIHDHDDRAAFSRDVLERASASGRQLPPETRRRLEEWVEFCAFRASLPPRLGRRVGDVATELRRGRYVSYVGSPMSALYDMVLG
jgi:glycosyltransferase involved in cell wall biosynthesis